MDIRVTIFEDNKSLREGLRQLLENSPGYTCAGAFENCRQLLKDITQSCPDVVLMDIQLPGISGIEAVRIIREKFPDIKILMQTIFEDNDKIFQSILAGASGYLLKNTTPARILEFINDTYTGGAPMSPSVATKVLKMVSTGHQPSAPNLFDLSDREKEVISCLVRGMSYKFIAETCQISIDTVRGHIRNIYKKLHVHSKSEAVITAIKGGIV